MRSVTRYAIVIICAALAVIGVIIYRLHSKFDVLLPAGTVAGQQRHLLIFATALMLLIVIPVIGLTFGIAWKYRATNTTADYQPDWDHSRKLEVIWWGFPLIIILILGVAIWTSSHHLEPSRALVSNQQPLTIQVVALQWKWLFLYPDQKIASINYLQLPVNRPVHFEITADAPMNSFWIPKLGGQIYAMPGMQTQLNLRADHIGNYRGSSANLSGSGFADMNFNVEAASADSFQSWSEATADTPNSLDIATYTALARPTILNGTKSFARYDDNLFSYIIGQYAGHQHQSAAIQSSTETTYAR